MRLKINAIRKSIQIIAIRFIPDLRRFISLISYQNNADKVIFTIQIYSKLEFFYQDKNMFRKCDILGCK